MSANATQSKVPASKPGAEPTANDDLKSLPMAEVEKKLGSSPDGLSQAEAGKRLTQYGPNEIEEKKQNVLLKILSYFWRPIPWMIARTLINCVPSFFFWRIVSSYKIVPLIDSPRPGVVTISSR